MFSVRNVHEKAPANGFPGVETSLAVASIVAVYTVPFVNRSCPTVIVRPAFDQLNVRPVAGGAIENAPSLAVVFIGSVKLTTRDVVVGTPTVPLAG